MKKEETMKITVKRETWFLGMLVPITLYLNNEEIGEISGLKAKEMKLPAASGILKYKSSLGKGNQINVVSGDYVKIKDSLLNTITSIFCMVWFIFLMINVFVFNNEDLTYGFGPVIITILVIILITSFFISSHKFIKVKK